MYRRPWYWLAVLAIAALVGSIIVVFAARARFKATHDAFSTAQTLRLQRVEQRVDAFFADAAQLVSATATTTAGVGDNRRLEEFLVRSLFVARRDPNVYGVGVFFEPFAFAPHARYSSIYVHAGHKARSRFDHLAGGIDEVTFAGPRLGEDYRRMSWYRVAVGHAPHIAYDGPYVLEGRSFISILRAFERHGRIAGVATVDTLTPTFQRMLDTGLLPGDVASIELPSGTVVVSSATPPSQGDRIVARMKLRYTRTYLALSTDAHSLAVADRGTVLLAFGRLIVIWGFAVLVGVGLIQRWNAEAEARRLTGEQQRLEDEVAVARRVEAELRKTAYTDTLTGLQNRAALMEALTVALARRAKGERHALFFVDLDRFNVINETLGHVAGDELLVIVAQRLAAHAATTFVARLGGDEFGLLVRCGSDELAKRADDILNAISEPALLYGHTFYPQASIGIVEIDESHERAEDLLRDADIAVYAAKDRGRARAAIFDSEMRRRVEIEAELESELRRAVDHGEIIPYYQPIVDLRTNQIVSFEALARWPRADGDVASGFVGFAERRGFVRRIDASILRSVCAHAAALLARFPDATIAVNVSAAELGVPGFEAQLGAMLEEYGVSPFRLKIEITETTMMASAAKTGEVIDALRARGLSLVLDDFGTGYSSLAYLQRIPIAGVKIDRSFVEHLPHDVRAVEIVRSIVALAGTFGLVTTAEGIETEEQRRVVSELGVDYGQGFFFSPAVPLEDLMEMPDFTAGVQ